MMNVTVICLGKLKESYLREAIAEYSKRISAYGKLNIVELSPVKLPESPSATQIDSALEKEAEEIIKKIPSGAFVIALCVEGKIKSSEELASKFNELSLSGKSNVTFIIGSSYGLHEDIKKRANYKLSFSKLTFPHGLFRGILLEQIYRSFKILNNETYHK